MRLRRRSTAKYVLLLIAALSPQAHEDYQGDIYPSVSIADSLFVVTYSNWKTPLLSQIPVGTTISPTLFVDSYTFSGEIIKKRRRVRNHEPFLFPAIDSPACSRPDYGTHYWRSDSMRYYSYRCHDKKNELPVIVLVNKKYKIIRKFKLLWDVSELMNVHTFAVRDGKFYIVASPQKDSGGRWNDSHYKMFLYVFEASTGKLLRKELLGIPEYIYFFAQVSNINEFSISDNNLYCAWISPEKSLFLSCFNMLTGQLQTHKVANIHESNTRPSIAVKGSTCLIAYHTLANEHDWNSSIIKTVFYKIDK